MRSKVEARRASKDEQASSSQDFPLVMTGSAQGGSFDLQLPTRAILVLSVQFISQTVFEGLIPSGLLSVCFHRYCIVLASTQQHVWPCSTCIADLSCYFSLSLSNVCWHYSRLKKKCSACCRAGGRMWPGRVAGPLKWNRHTLRQITNHLGDCTLHQGFLVITLCLVQFNRS